MPAPLLPLLAPMAAKGGLSAAQQAIEVLPTMLPTRYDKYNKEQMKRLEELAARHQLGLRANQKQNIRGSIVNPTTKAVGELQQLTPGVQGASPGQAMLQQMANQQALGAVTTQASAVADQAVRQADQAKRQQQRAELEERTKYLAGRRSEQLAAGLSIIPGAGKSMADEYMHQKTVGQGAPNELTNTTAAQSLFDQYADDPEMLDLILKFSGGM